MICFDFWDERERNTSVILDETKNNLFICHKETSITNIEEEEEEEEEDDCSTKNCTSKVKAQILKQTEREGLLFLFLYTTSSEAQIIIMSSLAFPSYLCAYVFGYLS